MPPAIQTQRDNLAIGLYLARGGFGATLDDILQAGIFEWGTTNVGSGMPNELAETRFAKGLLDTSPSMLCPSGGVHLQGPVVCLEKP